jgi:hypothetical protein
MRLTVILLVIIALSTFSASAQAAAEQSVDRVLRFSHTGAAQHIQEIATVVRSIAGIRETSADTSQKTLALSGTANQIALAEWLFKELDRTASTPADQSTPHEYHGDSSAGELVRVST